MAGTIQNLEIFGAGTHSAATGKVVVTEEDLDAIVESFSALHGTNVVKPHLKLGHTDAQKWFGQKNGVPSLGWIESVWRQGKKLLANVRDVPDAVLDMIRAGRYHNVSAEVYWDAPIEHNGKTFSRVLSAVALLGAEMPAVKDLAGLAQALFTSDPLGPEGVKATELTQENPAMFTQEQVDALVAAAVTKAQKTFSDEHAAEVTNLKTQLEVATNRATAAEGQIATVKAEARKAEATVIVEGAIKDGKLLPKQKDFAMAFLTSTDAKMKFGEGEKTTADLFKDFLGTFSKQVELNEKGDGKNSQQDFASAAEEVDVKTKQVMASDKLDYAAAMQKVFAADPSLKLRYAEHA